jgi:hypothetical protein
MSDRAALTLQAQAPSTTQRTHRLRAHSVEFQKRSSNLEVAHTGAFNGRPINENIRSAIVGMNVSASLFTI